MSENVVCAACHASVTLYPGRRVICLGCGADFGRVLKRPLHIEVPEFEDDWEPNLIFLTYLVEDALLEC